MLVVGGGYFASRCRLPESPPRKSETDDLLAKLSEGGEAKADVHRSISR